MTFDETIVTSTAQPWFRQASDNLNADRTGEAGETLLAGGIDSFAI